MKDATKIMVRHPENPLITPDSVPGAAGVFNPSPAMLGGKTILLLSVFPYVLPSQCVGSHVAVSDDGVHFTVNPDPFIDLSKARPPFNEIGAAMIDNRITPMDGVFYIQTPVYHRGEGPFTLLGKTTDFKSYEPIEITSLPVNRGSSIFPEKINGKYYRLDRPGADMTSATIWLSSSPDLIHWGCHRPLLRNGYAIWNFKKIGPTPPIRTAQGWLVIVHGVWSWMDSDHHYHIGAVLLDLNDPGKVIGFTKSWLLMPEKDYETRGTVDNVVFPCGALADAARDELRIYYGAADTRVGLATGSLSAVIEACKRGI